MQKYWNTRAQKLKEKAASHRNAPKDWDRHFINAFADIGHHKCLLDVCCGVGRMYPVLASHCDQYFGVDFSIEMLKQFPEIRSGDGIHLVDSASSLPFDDEMFDIVVTCVALQHIVNQKELIGTIDEIKRVLKTGGLFFSCEVMTTGIPVSQPFPSYQLIRPFRMYQFLFEPEISLSNKGSIRAPHHHIIHGIKQQTPALDEQIRLDVGCGVNKEPRYIGLDLSPKIHYGKRVTDIVASGYSLPLRDDSIDMLQCNNLLEHYDNPYPFLFEFYRVIKQNGMVTIRVPYAGTASGNGDPDHRCVFGPDTWALLFSGFFEKVEFSSMGLRFDGDERWKNWQKQIIMKGFYDMAQGGKFECTLPRELPEFRYSPWWLKDYIQGVVGADML